MARKVLLRLDDGQIVGPASLLGVKDAAPDAACLADIDTAFAAGRLPRERIGKLEDLMRDLVSRVPANGEAPRRLRTVQLKRTASEAFAEQHPRDDFLAETPRANGQLNLADDDEPGSPNVWRPGEFEAQCLSMIDEIWPMFKDLIIYFDRPVDTKYVPDYFNVVKREDARDLGTMKTNLQRRRYRSPVEFWEDMQQFFRNIHLYNKPNTPFSVLGHQVQDVFERSWVNSGLGGPKQRARRATAGVAAHKYEPQYEPPPPEKRPLPRTSSARSGPRPTRTPKVPRTQSQTSGGGARAAKNRGEMPRTRMQQIATALSSMEGDDLNGVLNIIRDSTNVEENGEIELDFDALDHGTLWKLDDYLRKINKGTGAGGTFQLVEDSASEDEESDSDSGDD